MNYTQSFKKHTDGFVALISVIIISAIILLIASTLSLSGFYGRYNILDSELKERSSAIADACVDIALLALSNDLNYAGSATTTIDADACFIGPVTTTGGHADFEVRSMYRNYFTNYALSVDTASLAVLSWQEIPLF